MGWKLKLGKETSSDVFPDKKSAENAIVYSIVGAAKRGDYATARRYVRSAKVVKTNAKPNVGKV